jgi:hypothetical protein
MIKQLRTYLSRMFEPYSYTPEGFRLTKQRYSGQDTVNLPAHEKRGVAVCNLFANQHKDIDEVVRILDTNRRTVISALIHEGLILDRRSLTRNPKFERRQTAKYHLPRVLLTGQPDESRSLCGQFGADIVTEFVFNELLKPEERCGECRKRSSGQEQSD